MCIAWKGRPQNDLCCFGWDVKPYSLLTLFWHILASLARAQYLAFFGRFASIEVADAGVCMLNRVMEQSE